MATSLRRRCATFCPNDAGIFTCQVTGELYSKLFCIGMLDQLTCFKTNWLVLLSFTLIATGVFQTPRQCEMAVVIQREIN